MKRMKKITPYLVLGGLLVLKAFTFTSCETEEPKPKVNPCKAEQEAYDASADKYDKNYAKDRKAVLQGQLPVLFEEVPGFKNNYSSYISQNPGDSLKGVVNVDGIVQASPIRTPEQKAMSAAASAAATLVINLEETKDDNLAALLKCKEENSK